MTSHGTNLLLWKQENFQICFSNQCYQQRGEEVFTMSNIKPLHSEPKLLFSQYRDVGSF